VGHFLPGKVGHFLVGIFKPVVVKKRQRDISGLEDRIISMYAKGTSTRDIKAHIEEIYGYEISA